MSMSKNEGIEKDGNEKDKTISKKGRYDLFIFQKTEKNRTLNIHSICNYSNHLFSVSYGYIFISFISDLIFPRIFS